MSSLTAEGKLIARDGAEEKKEEGSLKNDRKPVRGSNNDRGTKTTWSR